MQELYVEDLADHNGPGHAVGIVRYLSKRCSVGAYRRGIEPRNITPKCRPCVCSGKAMLSRALREHVTGFAGSLDPQQVRKPLCTRTGRAASL
jgi:hypothetical protein